MYAALEFQSFVSNMRNRNIPCIPFYLFKNKVCSIWAPRLFFISDMRNHSMKAIHSIQTACIMIGPILLMAIRYIKYSNIDR